MEEGIEDGTVDHSQARLIHLHLFPSAWILFICGLKIWSGRPSAAKRRKTGEKGESQTQHSLNPSSFFAFSCASLRLTPIFITTQRRSRV
jgi:hypothetical protein